MLTLTKQIKLRGKNSFYATVDAEDYDLLARYKWYYSPKGGYAKRPLPESKYKKVQFMHRLLNKTPDGYSTDHINGDGLDNRKSNLRTVTIRQNNLNRHRQSNNTSGFIGVSWAKQHNKWVAIVGLDGGKKFLGHFDDKEEAAEARRLYVDSCY